MIGAWLAHLATASGAVLAFLALIAVVRGDYRAAFLWLAVQIVVDSIDGTLARRARVRERLPWFNGAKLDDIVDYLTYVFVPAVLVWHAPLVPDGLAVPVAAAMLIASAYGFNRDDAKTADHFFTGFPSYWNIVVFYLAVGGGPPAANALVLLGLAGLVFVPAHYVYPSRSPVWRAPTIVFGAVWGAAVLLMLWLYPAVPRPLFWASLAYPAYYLILSFVLDRRRGTGRP